MKLGIIACALGHHRVDRKDTRRVHGAHVGRCRSCKTPMEEIEPHLWVVQKVRDAGLTYRGK